MSYKLENGNISLLNEIQKKSFEKQSNLNFDYPAYFIIQCISPDMIDHQINASYGDTISFDTANLVSIITKLGRCIELKTTTCDVYIP